MRGSKIYLTDIQMESILECVVEKKVNEHGQAKISGYINAATEQALLLQDYHNRFFAIMMDGQETGESTPLFQGIVETIKIESAGELKKLTITLAGGTRLLHSQKRIRTFQNTALTFEDIFEKVNLSYQDAMYMVRPKKRAIQKMVVQYQETDWEFIKRLASHLSTVVIPYYKSAGIRYYIGMESRYTPEVLEPISYSEINDINEYNYNKNNGMPDMMELDAYYTELVSRDYCDLGESVQLPFQKQPLYVYSVRSDWSGGEMIHTYLLKMERGFGVPKQYNETIIGASLDGQILAIQNDTVKVQISCDEAQDQATAKWFPYSTVYSSPDGTGWYCMPEKGDRVRVYFPNEKEEEAYAISSVNVSGSGSGNSRSNPDNKSISTKHGKVVELTPETIIITNSKGMTITLDDNEGISIISDKDVVMQSKESLSLTSENEGVNVEVSESIELIQGGSKITLKGDVVVEGAKFKLE